MCAYAYQVGAKPFGIYLNLAERLNGVRMTDYVRIFCPYCRKNFINRHNCSGFIVDKHNRHKNCAAVYRRRNIVGVDYAVGSRSNPNNFKAVGFKLVCGFNNTAVFYGRNHNSVTPALFSLSRAKQSRVI